MLLKNRRLWSRMGYAWAGLRAAWGRERSLRVQVWIALTLLPLLLWLRPAPLWWALIGVMASLVLAAELINTALEHLADHLHPELHPRIKFVKDCAAAAVLLLSVGALWVAAWMVADTLG
ncbi:MAG: diacylglycerol kinase [Pseudomonadota bacterium]